MDKNICRVYNLVYFCQMKKLLLIALLLLSIAQLIFSQTGKDVFVDSRDGNEYKIITIGKQTWMAENLRYLPAVSPVDSGYIYELYYYVYGYNGSNVDSAKMTDEYKDSGVLYNWLAAKDACPFGWVLPTENDWKQLETTLSETDLGSALASNTKEWKADKMIKSGRFAETQFNGFPAGYRDGNGFFEDRGKYAYFWTSKQIKQQYAYYRYIDYTETFLGHEHGSWENGYSVRCVKVFDKIIKKK